MKYRFIAIEGNIGAGKTSLAERLASDYRAKLIPEQFEDNPFLPRFYEEPAKYAFPLELSFLAARYQQLVDHLSPMDLFTTLTVSDYFIHKSLIFAKINLQEDEFNLYSRLFNIMMSSLPKPDLLVYLYMDVPGLQRNIQKRGRPYEKNIADDYLEHIQQLYLEHLHRLPDQRILIVDTNSIDFVNSDNHYLALKDHIFRDHPCGITPVLF